MYKTTRLDDFASETNFFHATAEAFMQATDEKCPR